MSWCLMDLVNCLFFLAALHILHPENPAAACSKVYQFGKPKKILRFIWFESYDYQLLCVSIYFCLTSTEE